jgi:hypothetical protein
MKTIFLLSLLFSSFSEAWWSGWRVNVNGGRFNYQCGSGFTWSKNSPCGGVYDFVYREDAVAAADKCCLGRGVVGGPASAGPGTGAVQGKPQKSQ